MFFSLLNHMIPLSDIDGEKANYFITNSNQYLFNSSSGLHATEMVLFDKSNVRNSKIFILQSSIKSYSGSSGQILWFSNKFDNLISSINLYKNTQKITGEELLSKCGCLRLGVARETGSGSIGFEYSKKITFEGGYLPFNPISNSKWEEGQLISNHLKINCITSYEYQYTTPRPIDKNFIILLNDL
jgi:hypothetical protein